MRNEKRNVFDPFGKGDGTDHIVTGGSGNVLRLGPGITAADLKLGLGSLALQVGTEPNDIIHFDSFAPANALTTKPFDSIEFEPARDSGQAVTRESRRWRHGERKAIRSAGNDAVFEIRRNA